MKKAIIIHGYVDKEEYLNNPSLSPSKGHWLPWIQEQLNLTGIETQNPEMPDFFEPNYEKWKKALEQLQPDENTILVGHSCGGGFIVRWLSENQVKVGKVILVAPWLDPEHEIDPEFFNFTIDPNIADKTNGLTVMYSTDDQESILKTIEILKSKLSNVQYKEFHNKGHFVLDSLHSEKFPELLEEILK
jgi:hypothetical protein